MRLPVDGYARLITLATTLAVTGCGIGSSGGDRVESATAVPVFVNGPSADYPMVLGEPYSIDGIEYVPADVMNYDEVGYVTEDPGAGITASHRTLPLPSYIEVTSLDTGRTILVRVERRGPMTGTTLVGLSAGAREQLGASEGTAVRVRRVNPLEDERALLRAGQAAPERLETPMPLVAVLKRKLPPIDFPTPVNASQQDKGPPMAGVAVESERQIAAGLDIPAPQPELPVTRSEQAKAEPSKLASGMVVQAATFSVEDNAKRAAEKLEGFVVPAGKYFRVRTGPYSTRGQADAALAKVKAAGYSDARVIDAG